MDTARFMRSVLRPHIRDGQVVVTEGGHRGNVLTRTNFSLFSHCSQWCLGSGSAEIEGVVSTIFAGAENVIVGSLPWPNIRFIVATRVGNGTFLGVATLKRSDDSICGNIG